MFTCESPSQAFVLLAHTIDGKDDRLRRLRYIGYDRACDLAPFITKMAQHGSKVAGTFVEELLFFVDRFHVKGHTEPCCQPTGDSAKYHPDLPQFAPIKKANTECAEQAFKWLAKFKNMMRYMSRDRFNFFFNVIIEERNIHRQQQIAKKSKRSHQHT